jgi:hypothetical protein
VARPHKHAGRSIEVVSGLPVEQLVKLCQDAAAQCKLRREGVKPGQLVFSVRGLVRPEKNKLMIFEVGLARDSDKLAMKSRILSYKTSQTKYLGLIPMEPRKHYADAIPLDLLKSEQERLTREIDGAEGRLAEVEGDFKKAETNSSAP